MAGDLITTLGLSRLDEAASAASSVLPSLQPFCWNIPQIVVGTVLLVLLMAYLAFIVIATDGEVLSELPEEGIDLAIGRAWSLIRRTK
jgi:hypothetical protein